MSRLRRQLTPTAYGPAATVAAAAALLLWGIVVQSRVVRAAGVAMDGTYTVTVRVAGYGKGAGSVTVDDKGVGVDCQVTDTAGNQQRLRATNLELDDSRFDGIGSLDGVRVRISGRIDPPDANISKPHVVATFIASDKRVGRIVGPHD